MKSQIIRLNTKIDNQRDEISRLERTLKTTQEKLTAALKEVAYQKRQVKMLKEKK